MNRKLITGLNNRLSVSPRGVCPLTPDVAQQAMEKKRP